MSLATTARRLVRSGNPVLTPLTRDLLRLKLLAGFAAPPVMRSLRWYLKSHEYTNFTYEITPLSEAYLTTALANALDTDAATIQGYLDELRADAGLAAYFTNQVQQTPDRYFADLPIKYGRRAGWYAIVRHVKPRLIVESGIDRGVGTVILAAAVLRNRAEGHEGRVIGLDINPLAGRYIAAPYAAAVEIAIGSSLETLRRIGEPVNLFIHDSDHTPAYEAAEYAAVADRLAADAILLSDNADLTDCLLRFAEQRGMDFAYWQEGVQAHVASAGGIGLALPRR